MLAEEDILKQVRELVTIPVKNYFEVRNIRKNMLANYGAKVEIELMDKIMSSEEISDETKFFLSAYIRSGAKKFFNQVKILDIALDNVKENDKVLTIDADWISDFWDKAKNVSNEYLQNIWGNVLYYNFINGKCTKTLLNALYLIDKNSIYVFDSIRKFTFQHAQDPRKVYSCIYFVNETKTYKKFGLHKYNIHDLSTLGLIEYDWNHKFILPSQKMCLKYGDKIIRVRSNKRLEYGNVRLTSDGSMLFNSLQPVVNEACFDFCVKKWKEHGDVVIEKDSKMVL